MSSEKGEKPTAPKVAPTGRLPYPSDDGVSSGYIQPEVVKQLREIEKKTRKGRRLNGLRPLPSQARKLVEEHVRRVEERTRTARRLIGFK